MRGGVMVTRGSHKPQSRVRIPAPQPKSEAFCPELAEGLQSGAIPEPARQP